MKHSRKLFEELECTNVEKAINRFIAQREKILQLSEKDAIRSAAFYSAFKRMTDEFIKLIENKSFPILKDGLWGYYVEYNQSIVNLNLTKYEETFHYADNDECFPTYEIIEEYSLVSVEPNLLSIGEYAQNYHVDPRTVTQWIRRGKIKTAKKIGNTWMIPETADTPQRGYNSDGMYILNNDIRPLSDDYPFLQGIKWLKIEQDDEDKKKYFIICHTKDEGFISTEDIGYIQEYIQKDKEKFELALITHPGVKYIPDFRETMILDIIKVYNEGENE